MIKPVIASLGLFIASTIIRMIACKVMAGGEEQDAKAEQQAATLYLHEKILGVVTAGICFAVIADKIGSTHPLGCFLALRRHHCQTLGMSDIIGNMLVLG